MTITAPVPAESVEADAVAPGTAQVAAVAHDSLVEEDLLVEDVSIDGMCGVY